MSKLNIYNQLFTRWLFFISSLIVFIYILIFYGFIAEIINNDLGKSLTENIETLFPDDAIVSTTITGEEIKNRTPKPPKHSVTNYVLVCECKAKVTIPTEDFNNLQIEDFIRDTVCICGGGFVDTKATIDKPHVDQVDKTYGNNTEEIPVQTTEETNK